MTSNLDLLLQAPSCLTNRLSKLTDILLQSFLYKIKIFDNNSFQFDIIDYIQTLGTAIGTKMAPTYANLTLTCLNENLYEIIGEKYNNIETELIISWKRYQDDCFLFWKCSWGSINCLHNLLQNLYHKKNH